MYDCLQANKSLCAWGVEGRVPFLDKEFLDVAMRLNPEAKMCPGSVIEKSNKTHLNPYFATGIILFSQSLTFTNSARNG